MTHKEAFALMLYRCETCQFEERIWNSRDGTTPFIVDCRRCGEDSMHADWHQDLCVPDYDPFPGDRYFRDGTEAEARAIVRRRLERARGTPYEVPEDGWREIIDRCLAREEITPPWGGKEKVAVGEFQPGWPQLVVRGTDADSLPGRQ